MHQASYCTGLKCSLTYLRGQCFAAVNPALGQGWVWLPSRVQQIRFASGQDKKGWYDWYARLGVNPRASVKDLKKAYYNKAKVEHPDRDKSPGAAARFRNLQQTYENLCVEWKRAEHDQQRLARQRAAAAARAQMTARQASVVDNLRAKWKAEEDTRRKDDEMRTRNIRTTAKVGHQQPKTTKSHGPKADVHDFQTGPYGPRTARTDKVKEKPPKQEQRQARSKETEEDHLRKQKLADDLLAKQKTTADGKKRKNDAAAHKTDENNCLHERVIITMRGLEKGTKLVDLFEPLVTLMPGPVFSARFLSHRMAAIEFCTDATARRILDVAKERGLLIKGKRVTDAQLTRSMNKIPATGSISRVLKLSKVRPKEEHFAKGILEHLSKHGLQVERIVSRLEMQNSTMVRLASWADAEKAKRLLGKHLPEADITYAPDPCEAMSSIVYRAAGFLLRFRSLADTERKREEVVESIAVMLLIWIFLAACALVADYAF